MTQDRRITDKLPAESLVFTDAVLIAAAQEHLRAERSSACLLPVPDTDPQLYVAAGTKDALRGLLRDDPVGDTEVLAGLDWKAPVAASSEAAAPDLSGWVSLGSSRPADFQPVLVALNTGTVVVGKRASMGWHWDETDDLADADATATHWMPLPAAPAISKSPTSLAGSGEKGGE